MAKKTNVVDMAIEQFELESKMASAHFSLLSKPEREEIYKRHHNLKFGFRRRKQSKFAISN